MSRLIKKKIVNLKMGEKQYRYIEILKEIVNNPPSVTIDLTMDSSISKERSFSERKPAAKKLRLDIPKHNEDEKKRQDSTPDVILVSPDSSPTVLWKSPSTPFSYSPLMMPSPDYSPASPSYTVSAPEHVHS